MDGTVLLPTQHNATSKWNILFDDNPKEWISFKPKLGQKVYPCYSCRTMFSTKSSFQDHINRRIITIVYNCCHCSITMTFYNRCSFMLHARKHFSFTGGRINLRRVELVSLPMGLLGFSTNPTLYNEPENYLQNDDIYINTQFYTPDPTRIGRDVVIFKPQYAIFESNGDGTTKTSLVLKQLCHNIPLCKFVLPETIIDLLKKSSVVEDAIKKIAPEKVTNTCTNQIILTPVVTAVENGIFTLPIISKIESLSGVNLQKFSACPECSLTQKCSMTAHFLGSNKPLDETLHCSVCKYIAPSKCSLKAHCRVHDGLAPFVCPECGKTFKNSATLNTHMDDVCFHLTKQIRFRCPGKKCGKLFASPVTYASHFIVHLQSLHQCSDCDAIFFKYLDFVEHAKKHAETCKPKVAFHCTVCQNMSHPLTQDNYKQHIKWHTNDRSRSMYVHICRHCRSYFRSNVTFAAHTVKCSKSDRAMKSSIDVQCTFCKEKMVCSERDIYKKCPHCCLTNYFASKPLLTSVNSDADLLVDKSLHPKNICVLCKEEIAEGENEEAEHAKVCKYYNPIVNVQKIPQNGTTTNRTITDPDQSLKTKTRRKRPASSSAGSVLNAKNKKLALMNTSGGNVEAGGGTTDLQADEPVAFNGTYYCRLCDYRNENRVPFHEHIVKHRDSSTVFQCMECGECFVVKPSLVKHLVHFHKTTDVDAYLSKNDCFDRSAVEELENHLKLAPGETSGPVNENQCTVCLKQFDDSISLNKHFRIHGMAFLLQKTK